MPQPKNQNPVRSKPAQAKAPRLHATPGSVSVVVCATLVASGIFHGLWTGRWHLSKEPAMAAERLEQVPMTFGDWDGDTQEMDERQVRAAGATGHLNRRYVNRETGDTVWATVLCGPPGPIAVHPPDVCFRGVGFQPSEKPTRHMTSRSSGSGNAEYWTAKFVKNAPTGTSAMRIFWAWSATGTWLAPENPRLAFAHHKVLYKLYLQHGTLGGSDPNEFAQLDEFARVFVEELNRSLFGETQERKASNDRTLVK